MERKRIEKLVVLLLIGILLPVSLFPFRINADTITNSNVNINYYLDSVTETASGTYMQTYRVEFVFDQSYLGWISSKMVGTYINNNTVPVTTAQYTKTQSIYVNGVTAETSFTFVTPNNMNGGALQSLSQSIQNSNVTPLADLSTLDDILNVLTDINNNIEIDVLDELQSIVANTELANTYLEDISKLRRFDIPIESLIYNLYLIKNYEQYLYYDSPVYFQYPVYRFTNLKNVLIQYTDANVEYDWIFITDCSQPALLRNYMTISNADASVTFKETHNLGNVPNMGYVYYYHAILKSTRNASTIVQIDFSQTSPNIFVGVLLNRADYKNYSTDFALQNGLTNKLLDNLQIIANGTQQSQSASGSLDQTTSQFSDDANDLVTIEESFNNSMNQSLLSVNPTFNMGSSFLTSANWVSQQFNRIVNNTPFASLITFGLTLGLGLLIIGKVRK